MVHVPQMPDPLPQGTARLAAATMDDLRVARSYVERTCDRIAMDRHGCNEQLDSIPLGRLIELSSQIAELEAAASRAWHDAHGDALQLVAATR